MSVPGLAARSGSSRGDRQFCDRIGRRRGTAGSRVGAVSRSSCDRSCESCATCSATLPRVVGERRAALYDVPPARRAALRGGLACEIRVGCVRSGAVSRSAPLRGAWPPSPHTASVPERCQASGPNRPHATGRCNHATSGHRSPPKSRAVQTEMNSPVGAPATAGCERRWLAGSRERRDPSPGGDRRPSARRCRWQAHTRSPPAPAARAASGRRGLPRSRRRARYPQPGRSWQYLEALRPSLLL